LHVGRDGSAALFRAALPGGLGAINETTSSLSASLSHFQNEANGFDQSLPAGGFRFKLFSASSRQLVKLRFTPGFGLFPVGRQETAIFKAV
jgi:hypothetical protein